MLDVPKLSRFYGIIIRMYVEAGGPHYRPHFHAYYGDEVAIYTMSSIQARCLAVSGAW